MQCILAFVLVSTKLWETDRSESTIRFIQLFIVEVRWEGNLKSTAFPAKGMSLHIHHTKSCYFNKLLLILAAVNSWAFPNHMQRMLCYATQNLITQLVNWLTINSAGN